MALLCIFDYVKIVGKAVSDSAKLACTSNIFLPGCHITMHECRKIIFDVKILGPLFSAASFDDPLFFVVSQCNSYES